MTTVGLKLQRVSWSGYIGTFTAFVVATDEEADAFNNATHRDVAVFQGRIMHMVRGDNPTDEEAEGAWLAFEQLCMKSPPLPMLPRGPRVDADIGEDDFDLNA